MCLNERANPRGEAQIVRVLDLLPVYLKDRGLRILPDPSLLDCVSDVIVDQGPGVEPGDGQGEVPPIARRIGEGDAATSRCVEFHDIIGISGMSFQHDRYVPVRVLKEKGFRGRERRVAKQARLDLDLFRTYVLIEEWLPGISVGEDSLSATGTYDCIAYTPRDSFVEPRSDHSPVLRTSRRRATFSRPI